MTKINPYESVYWKQPHSLTTYLLGMSKVQEVKTLLQNCEWELATLKDNLAKAHNHMKQQVDKHHSKWSFEVENMVFLWLQPYKNTFLKYKHHQISPQSFINLINFSTYWSSGLQVIFSCLIQDPPGFLGMLLKQSCGSQLSCLVNPSRARWGIFHLELSHIHFVE